MELHLVKTPTVCTHLVLIFRHLAGIESSISFRLITIPRFVILTRPVRIKCAYPEYLHFWVPECAITQPKRT